MPPLFMRCAPELTEIAMPASLPGSALIIGALRGLGRAFQSCEDDAVDGRHLRK